MFGYAQKHGLAMTGPPFARYPEVGMGSLVIEGGVTVAEPPATTLDDGIEALAPWETYLTDPGERPDPATWETEIVQPVA